MFDSDQPDVLGSIQLVPARVATYADLLMPEIVTRFGSRLAVIDRGLGDPMQKAHIVDIESVAYTVESGAALIKEWVKKGRLFPTVYVNRDNWAAVMQACLPVKPYEWVATLDGSLQPNGRFPHLTQFAGEQALGLHADVSVVWDEGWLPQGHVSNPRVVAAIRNQVASLQTLSAAMEQVALGL
jgi:hypothetical protein